jgi:hypothetical protein
MPEYNAALGELNAPSRDFFMHHNHSLVVNTIDSFVLVEDLDLLSRKWVETPI